VLAKTILFVDDESSILACHRVLFEALGYSVLTADSGAEALILLRTHSVDAVVLDYAMSPMNGEETARRVRREHGNIPIVLFSGCLPVPNSVLEVFDVSVEKGAGPEILAEALRQLLQTLSRKRK
jgi:CheY-like chemotaxis protein